MAKLKFSSIEQPELVGYVALLGLSDRPELLEIEEIADYADAVNKKDNLPYLILEFVVVGDAGSRLP